MFKTTFGAITIFYTKRHHTMNTALLPAFITSRDNQTPRGVSTIPTRTWGAVRALPLGKNEKGSKCHALVAQARTMWHPSPSKWQPKWKQVGGGRRAGASGLNLGQRSRLAVGWRLSTASVRTATGGGEGQIVNLETALHWARSWGLFCFVFQYIWWQFPGER